MAEDELIASWEANAEAWTRAVRGRAIPSRELGTDRAIVEAATSYDARRVLDLGCGEGWLTRELSSRGREVVGVDASPSLLAAARSAGVGVYHCCAYAELERAVHGPFELVVANFALLGEELGPSLAAVAGLLAPHGSLLIQTLHPLGAGAPYRDGWRREDFAGFGSPGSWTPMPWYFRTVGSWVALLRELGFELARIDEPLHPQTALPLSLLLHATRRPGSSES